MIISRTPFRISFFGGGTDYPLWYRERGGAVLGCSINKYCYISCRYLPPFFQHRIRVVYSKIENCQTVDDIQHPSVRECLKFLNLTKGMEIHHDGDLPARGGIGSSSAFTVGLLHALQSLIGRSVSKQELARQAIHLEQNVLQEAVGSQDQVLTCYGGINRVQFHRQGDITVEPVCLDAPATRRFNQHFLLFFTGIQRVASEVAATYVHQLDQRKTELSAIADMVNLGAEALVAERYSQFGELLDEYWRIKRSLGSEVSRPGMDQAYQAAREAGAWGGKLVGAGGGGYLLLFAPPQRHAAIREQLSQLLEVPFQFEYSGSRIIFFDKREEY